jgi:ATP-dependent Clp protease ATP-binding subunit ClpX
MGFGQVSGFRDETESAEVLPQVTSDDVLEYGLIPELVGRLPVNCALTPLNVEGLIQVLTQPKNALVRQYQSLFQMENCELSFTETALRRIAERAMGKGTGARGLRSIIEDVMLDIMYELPDQSGGTSYVIDDEVVGGQNKLFKIPDAPRTKSA